MVVGQAAAINEGMEEGNGTDEDALMEIDPENAVTERNSSSGVQVVQSPSPADSGAQALVTLQTSRLL